MNTLFIVSFSAGGISLLHVPEQRFEINLYHYSFSLSVAERPLTVFSTAGTTVEWLADFIVLALITGASCRSIIPPAVLFNFDNFTSPRFHKFYWLYSPLIEFSVRFISSPNHISAAKSWNPALSFNCISLPQHASPVLISTLFLVERHSGFSQQKYVIRSISSFSLCKPLSSLKFVIPLSY